MALITCELLVLAIFVSILRAVTVSLIIDLDCENVTIALPYENC